MPMFLSSLRRRRLSSVFATVALATLAVAGCESSTGSDDTIAVVYVNPPTPVLGVGSVQQLVASPTTASGRILEGQTVEWTTSAPAVATVTAAGLVTAIGGGSATITATVGEKSATATITVWFPVQTINLAPAAGNLATIRQEGSTQLVPTYVDTQGATVTGRQAVWTSSNPAVATVDASGRVSALGIDGTTTVTARAEGVDGTFLVTVSGPPVVATVTLAVTTNRWIGIGQTEQFVATARAASGTVLSLAGRAVAWSSSVPARATVDANGLVSMLADSGSSNIGITVDGVAATAIAAAGAKVLTPGVNALITIKSGSTHNYVLTVPAGSDTLRVTMAGIAGVTGDPDMWLYRPNIATFMCQSAASGPAELCLTGTVLPATIAAGRWRIEVNAWDGDVDVSNVNLRAVIHP